MNHILKGACPAEDYCILNAPNDQKHLIWCVEFDGNYRYAYNWTNFYDEKKDQILERYKNKPLVSDEEFYSYRLVIKRNGDQPPEILGIYQGDYKKNQKDGYVIRYFKKLKIMKPYYQEIL